SLHDALPIFHRSGLSRSNSRQRSRLRRWRAVRPNGRKQNRSWRNELSLSYRPSGRSMERADTGKRRRCSQLLLHFCPAFTESARRTATSRCFPVKRQTSFRLSFRGLALTTGSRRSEEHTSELQSRENLVCRLLL